MMLLKKLKSSSFGQSVDQVLSAQYNTNFLKALYSVCSWREDDPYWFSDHGVKGQSQTASLHEKCC